jgi:hypothetical protein
MNPALARDDWFARRKTGRIVRWLRGVALAAAVLVAWPARAQTGAVEPPPASPQPTAPPASASAAPLPPSAATPAAPANPALDLQTPTPAAEPGSSVFRRWWFWTAVGAAAAATVAVIWVSSSGNAPPATDLGNQEFQP